MRIAAAAVLSALLLSPLAGAADQAKKEAAKVGASSSKEGASGALYKVEGGTKVDNRTLQGWRTWRALACERCHGAQQEGLVGPSLLESIKKLSKEEFHKILMEGRIDK